MRQALETDGSAPPGRAPVPPFTRPRSGRPGRVGGGHLQAASAGTASSARRPRPPAALMRRGSKSRSEARAAADSQSQLGASSSQQAPKRSAWPWAQHASGLPRRAAGRWRASGTRAAPRASGARAAPERRASDTRRHTSIFARPELQRPLRPSSFCPAPCRYTLSEMLHALRPCVCCCHVGMCPFAGWRKPNRGRMPGQ